MAERLYGLNASQVAKIRDALALVRGISGQLPNDPPRSRAWALVRVTSSTQVNGYYPAEITCWADGEVKADQGSEVYLKTAVDAIQGAEFVAQAAGVYSGRVVYYAPAPNGFWAKLTAFNPFGATPSSPFTGTYSFQPIRGKVAVSGTNITWENAPWPPPGVCGGHVWIQPIGGDDDNSPQLPTLPASAKFSWYLWVSGSGNFQVSVNGTWTTLAAGASASSVASALNAIAPSGVTFAVTSGIHGYQISTDDYVPTPGSPFAGTPNNPTLRRPVLSAMPETTMTPAANGPAFNTAEASDHGNTFADSSSTNAAEPRVPLGAVVWMRLVGHKVPTTTLEMTGPAVCELWITGSQAGEFRLLLDRAATAAIAHDASASAVASAVSALAPATVTALTAGAWHGWEITFTGDVPEVALDAGRLLGPRTYAFTSALDQLRTDAVYVRHLLVGTWAEQTEADVDGTGWLEDAYDDELPTDFAQADVAVVCGDFDCYLTTSSQTVTLEGGGTLTAITGVTLHKRRTMKALGVNKGSARLDVIN